MRPVRCAIYTRKSSEEGLEQGFNSLDAQREACAAYIRSQASEGWAALPDLYDDGGISGGTLERPALKRLLADVEAGRVDVIVVYKVDRLSRSLFDFAKLVELLEKATCSFVSITQPISTTTSMGRLTLNMLLSFAQFEREVTAERIRDKIAASKAKGMFMGGVPPLGYRNEGRTLVVVEEHAALVRHIFNRYLTLRSVRRLTEDLDKAGIHTPIRTLDSGRTVGGPPFAEQQLRTLLSNRLLIGEIPHHDVTHKGLHPAIIDKPLWDEVQAALAAHAQGGARQAYRRNASLLAGRIVDEQARRYWAELRKGELNVTELAEREKVGAPYITRVLRLAFLSPQVVEAVLAGKQRAGVTPAQLLSTGAIDPRWGRQARTFVG